MESLIKSVGQVSIRVHDVERSIEFYQGKLGLPLLFNAGRLAFIQCGHVRLMLSLPELPEFDHPSSPIYLDVDEINSVVVTLRDRGISFDDEPHVVGRLGDIEVWMAFFRDPDGNLLAVQSEVPVKG
jgi:catechol 2,3-dioxygenase-like lactoylglutathione lyase family enzyme